MWNKQAGKIELAAGMFLLIFLIVLLAAHIQIIGFYTTSLYMEDALAASNLASAIIDIEEYGTTHVIRIASPESAYEIYRQALKTNLQLNEDWENDNKELIAGKVTVLQYIIYNVEGDDVTVYHFGEGGTYSHYKAGSLGSIRTPDGRLVESTSVYSRIGFPVKGFLDVEVYAEKEKSVDIINNGVE